MSTSGSGTGSGSGSGSGTGSGSGSGSGADDETKTAINVTLAMAIVKTVSAACDTAATAIDLTNEKIGEKSSLAAMKAVPFCSSATADNLKKGIQDAMKQLIGKRTTGFLTNMLFFIVTRDPSADTLKVVDKVAATVDVAALLPAIATQVSGKVVSGKVVDTATGLVNLSVSGEDVYSVISKNTAIATAVAELATAMQSDSDQRGLYHIGVISVTVLLLCICCCSSCFLLFGMKGDGSGEISARSLGTSNLATSIASLLRREAAFGP